MSEMDHIFKNKLKNHTSPVSETSWENIEKRLPRQKSGHRLVGWGIATVFVIAAAGSLMLASYLNESNALQSENKFSTQATERTWMAEADRESVEFPVPSTLNDLQPTQAQSQLSDTEDSKFQLGQNSKMVSSATYDAGSDLSSTDVNSESDMYESRETEISHVDSFEEVLIETTFSTEPEATLTSHYFHDERSQEHIPLLTSEKNKSLLDGAILNHVTRDKEACSFIWRGYQKSLDIYYSSDFADIQLSGPEEFKDYLDMREATEKTVYSHSMGVRLGYNVGYRWNLHTGIQYSQMNQKFQYTDPEAHEPRIEIIKQYIYSNGQLVDSTFTEKIEYLPGSKHHRIYNKYSTFDIPVLARYTLAANNRWSVSAMAGIFLNVAFQQSGIILDTDNTTPIYLARESEGTQIFKAGLGVSFYSALSMAYYLSPAWDLLVEPNVRIAPSSMTTSDYPLTQRFNVYGLGVGLRYRF